jgi:hypothetical protein
VAERTAEQIRKEIAAERAGLQDDVDALKARLRRLVPFLIAVAVAVALLTVVLFIGIRKLRERN